MLEANVKIISELKQFIRLVMANPALLQKFCIAQTDFTRNRKLPFDRLVLLISRLCKKTLSIELEKFFEETGSSMNCTVSAFTQQRLKLEPTFFYYWNQVLTASYYFYYGQAVKRWNGYRLIAADGSNISLINNAALSNHFGGQSNQHSSFVQAKTFYHYDVLNELIVLSRIKPYRYGEFNMAYDAVGQTQDDMLLLYDRNFSNYKMIALHLWQERERKFVIRAKENLKLVSTFMESGKISCVVQMHPTAEAIVGLEKCGFIVSKKMLLTVRLVRVQLDNSVEVLLTNLWEEEGYGSDIFKDLYGMRWGIETNIAVQKNTMQLESFSGLTVPAVSQDFYATVMIANLHSMLIKTAQQVVEEKKGERKYPVKVNKNQSFGRFRLKLVALFVEKDITLILQTLISHFIKELVPVREGRSFQRVRKNGNTKGKFKTFTNFKPAF